MGTSEEILELKQKILKALKLIGLNKSQFAGKYFDLTSHSESELERKAFMNTFNRQFSRPGKTGKIQNTLKAYLMFIYDLQEYKKAGLTQPRNVFYPEADEELRRHMTPISKSIDEALGQNALIVDKRRYRDD